MLYHVRNGTYTCSSVGRALAWKAKVVGSNPTGGSSFLLEKGKMGCLRCCCVVCHLCCLNAFLLSTMFMYILT